MTAVYTSILTLIHLPLYEGFGGSTARSKLYASVFLRVSDVLWMNCQRLWMEHTNIPCGGSISRNRTLLIVYFNSWWYPSARFVSRSLPNFLQFKPMWEISPHSMLVAAPRIQKNLYYRLVPRWSLLSTSMAKKLCSSHTFL